MGTLEAPTREKRADQHGLAVAMVGVIVAFVAVGLTIYLEWDRIWIPGLQVPAGIEYRAIWGGPPPSYREQLVITNQSERMLENVECMIRDPDSGNNFVIKIPSIDARSSVSIDNLGQNPYGPKLPDPPYEIDPRDTITVSADGFVPRSVSVKQLGKEKSLNEMLPPK
jgi:hypothetical protein